MIKINYRNYCCCFKNLYKASSSSSYTQNVYNKKKNKTNQSHNRTQNQK